MTSAERIFRKCAARATARLFNVENVTLEDAKYRIERSRAELELLLYMILRIEPDSGTRRDIAIAETWAFEAHEMFRRRVLTMFEVRG